MIFTTNIDWKLIAEAIDYYKNKGFTYIEVPWIVSRQAIITTFKGNSTMSNHGCLVGSAEQSFVQMIMDGRLKEGKYVAATPCYRDELEHDSIHYPYFFKVELISIYPKSPELDLNQCINQAKDFFVTNCDGNVNLEKTKEGFDLSLNGIEIGSYGIRNVCGIEWVYGTGLAEPRFSYAKIF